MYQIPDEMDIEEVGTVRQALLFLIQESEHIHCYPEGSVGFEELSAAQEKAKEVLASELSDIAAHENHNLTVIRYTTFRSAPIDTSHLWLQCTSCDQMIQRLD